MNIIILSAAPRSSATKSIINAGTKRGHKMIVLDPKHLYLIVSDAVNGYDRVFDGYDKKSQPVRIKAKDIDAVISRIGNNLAYGTSVLQHFRYNLGIFTTQTPGGIKTASDKLLSLQKISTAKIKVPKTVIADNSIHIDWLVEQVGGLPAIAKMLRGSQGIGVMILESKLQTNTTLETFYKTKTKLLLQQFINSNAKDIRAIVINGKVIVAMERTAPDGDLRANVSLGGSGRKIELSEADKEICIKASQACGLEVSGVDLLKDTDGTSYIIEVNGNYGYHVESITNTDISTPLIKYCEDNYNKAISNEVSNTEPTISQTENDDNRPTLNEMYNNMTNWLTYGYVDKSDKDFEKLYFYVNAGLTTGTVKDEIYKDYKKMQLKLAVTIHTR